MTEKTILTCMLYFGMTQLCNLSLLKRHLSTMKVRPYNQVNNIDHNVKGEINHKYHFDV